MTTTLGRGDTYPLENYKKGTRVWLRDSEHVWIRAELLDDLTFSSTVVRLLREHDGEEVLEPLKPEALPFLANPDILIGKDDLTALSYLHEPAVLHNLRYRFENREAIYTYCGIVLVAINPYADCSQIYGDDVIGIYGNAGNQGRSDLDPHIYAIAAEAYYDMKEYEKNQSIIVSGESGAGKTVSAKFVMKYLANVAGSRKHRRSGSSDNSPGVESRVLASNPIMESIGNAKTIRNDNSSRFGKFIQINFADDFSIAGAEMKTYLLEKSRVVFQSKNERNYHIFYQMCAASGHPLLSGLGLNTSDDYIYTNQGQDPSIPGVDDKADFNSLVKAFDILKIDSSRQAEIFRIFAGVLELGNIVFDSATADSAVVGKGCESTIQKVCSESLFAVDSSALKTWLTAREIRAGGEVVRKLLNVSDACANRDALAKMIYACLFNWIVDKINENLDQGTAKSKRSSKFIGVLDIYGFETFEINSFEQFCINYANEKLQQQFNQHVFKLEQSEYEKEEISWVRIEFYDNQPCIDLIEARPGVIDYLDEQCKMGRGSDADWLSQMANCPKLKKAPHLQMPKFKDPSFVVKHFAADVSYKIDGFLEKNKDTVNEQLLDVFSKTKFSFLKEVIRDILASSSTGAKRKKTVACQFRDSLAELISVLSSTRPHYVRCIKPNDDKERFYFEPKRAIQQLRACGVLETVRISAAGYPSRWAYDEFGRRYRVLYPEGKALWKQKPKEFAKLACAKWLEPEKFALGKTKMFFRVGQVARLEKIRQDVLAASALRIQTTWRGFVARRRYTTLLNSIRVIQAVGRSFLAYRRLKYLQMQRATIVIQTAFRGHRERKKFNQLRNAVIAMQAIQRGNVVRAQVLAIRYEKSALTIQRYFRGYLVRREQIRRVQKIVKVQGCVRRWLAKRELKKLKAERTTVMFWSNKHQSLEKKIIEMQGRIDNLASERNSLADRCVEIDDLRNRIANLTSERECLVSESTRLTARISELSEVESQFSAQSSRLSALEAAFAQLEAQNIAVTRELREANATMSTMRDEVSKLKSINDDLTSTVNSEREKCRRLEAESQEMRQQLASNADLIVSEFSRTNELRASMRSTSSDGHSLPDASEPLVRKMQDSIDVLRTHCALRDRDLSRLQNSLSLAQGDVSDVAFEAQRRQDLEVEVARLKREILELCHGGGDQSASDIYLSGLIEDLDNVRLENCQLRTMLSTAFERRSEEHSPRPPTDGDDSCYFSTANSDDGNGSLPSDREYVDEQLERERLIRKLKAANIDLCRQLHTRDKTISELEEHVLRVKGINNDGSSEASSSSAAGLHARVFCDNMFLQQTVNRQAMELSELRSQLRGWSEDLTASPGDPISAATAAGDGTEVLRLTALDANSHAHSGLLHVYNVPEFARILIFELKPRLAKQLTPCLPAYLLLAAFRFYDREKDDTAITSLFGAAHTVLRTIGTDSNDPDILSLWLVNTWRLFNLLRQYSGEENATWHEQNTDKQNSHQIANFNLEPLRNQLKLRVEVLYQSYMKKAIEPLLSPKIVPGILQHDSTQLLAGPSGPPHAGLTRQPSKDIVARALDDLLELLNVVHMRLSMHGADEVLIGQCFWQITQWICAQALNNLMYRKDLCKFEKAIQIKHNVSEIQTWLFKHGLGHIRAVLEPLVQACHLLQSRKDEGNLDTLCGEMTSALNPKQVVSILQHYTPSDSFEEDPITIDFLTKVQVKLVARAVATAASDDTDKLLIPGTLLTPFNSEPFVYSDVALETLTLPTCLHLGSVARFV
uniref:Myosin motor domain-containing protein n=1 Tax=Panagrellus redivivus TaxID=6233 RepID=A0A7E4ZTC1_PANRE